MWLDDVAVVTRGSKGEYTQQLESVHTKLEHEGYEAARKIAILLRQKVCLGHAIAQDGIRPNKEKTHAISRLNPQTNSKTRKTSLGAIQYFAKFISNLSEKTDIMRRLLKREQTKWELDRRAKY